MQVNLTFLNPIEVRFHSIFYFQCPHTHHFKPRDWVKQSIPFSYLTFTANSLDGASHAVQVYSDVSGGTSDRSSEPVVSFQLRFRVQLGGSNEDDFVEPVFHYRYRPPHCHAPGTGSVHRDHRPSGMGYSVLCHASRKLIVIYLLSYSRSVIQGDNVTNKIAAGDDSRKYFARNGTLDDQYDSNIRAINNQFAVFAIARDLGTIRVTQAPVVWTVGYTTDPAINYADLSGAPPTSRMPYYKTQYLNDEALVSINITSCGGV